MGQPHMGPFDALFMGPSGHDKAFLEFMALREVESVGASPFTGASSSESGQSRDDPDEEVVKRLSRLQVRLQDLYQRLKPATEDGCSTPTGQKGDLERDSFQTTTDVNDIFMATIDFTDVLHDQPVPRPADWPMDDKLKCSFLSCYLGLVDIYDAASERVQRLGAKAINKGTGATTNPGREYSASSLSASTLASDRMSRPPDTGCELYLQLLSQMRLHAKRCLDKYR
jgi:hypothetical protein